MLFPDPNFFAKTIRENNDSSCLHLAVLLFEVGKEFPKKKSKWYTKITFTLVITFFFEFIILAENRYCFYGTAVCINDSE